MTAPLRIALAQLDAVVGDIAGNEARIAELIAQARDAGAQLVCFPELALTGYPPEDLLLKEHFLADARAALERLAAATTGIVAIVGYPERAEDVHNAAAVLADGAVQASYRKVHLPNYGVFDELRYFQPGDARRDDRGRRRHGRPDDLRGRLAARPAAVGRGARRRAPHRQHLRLAVRRRQGAAARADARPARARRPRGGRVLRPRRRAGRARLRRVVGRPGPRRRGDRPRAAVRGGAARRRGRHPSPPARRACATPAAARRRPPRDDAVDRLGSFTVRDRPSDAPLGEPASRAAARRGRRGLRRARPRHARLRPQERLRARRARTERRHRLDARRAHRRRRRRAGLPDLRDDALAVLVGGHARRRARARGEHRLRAARAADRADDARRSTPRSPSRSPAASPTSPRRTSRRASAATCSWRCRTSSAGSS